jgi:hypothetical protein
VLTTVTHVICAGSLVCSDPLVVLFVPGKKRESYF